MSLRRTKKVMAILGVDTAEPGPAPDPGDWYANLLWLDRHKCLLLTHAATLFSVFGNLRSQELTLAKTADRSVLGCVNDMAFRCEAAISDAGGLAHCDPGALNQALHRNINSSREYQPRLNSPHNGASEGSHARQGNLSA